MVDWTLLAIIVTALATAVLSVFTWILAKETRRMADATGRPHVVASLEPSPWSIIHTNLVIKNSGNGVAYNIVVEFDPPIVMEKDRTEYPLQKRVLSLLPPAQSFEYFLRGFKQMETKEFSVSISWLRDPASIKREFNNYKLDLKSDYEDWGRLGGEPPLIQISKEMKKIREEITRFRSQ